MYGGQSAAEQLVAAKKLKTSTKDLLLPSFPPGIKHTLVSDNISIHNIL